MISRVVPVDFPNATVKAVAAQNADGSYTIYTNTALPPEAQRAELQKMERRTDKEVSK